MRFFSAVVVIILMIPMSAAVSANLSILARVEALNFSFCGQTSKIEDCFNKTCEIAGEKKCFLSEEKDAYKKIIVFLFKGKIPKSCSPEILKKELISPAKKSPCWKRTYEKNPLYSGKNREISMTIPGPKLLVDSAVHVLSVTDPLFFVQTTYCYYVFQKLINSKELPPEFFAFHVKGASLSDKDLLAYDQWLTGDQEGKKCSKNVANLGLSLSKAEEITKKFMGQKFLVMLNLRAFIPDGVGVSYDKNLENIYNHERLHVIFAQNPEKKKIIQVLWDKLSADDKAKFINEHSSYDFKEPDILLREFFSYTFENDPKKGEELK